MSINRRAFLAGAAALAATIAQAQNVPSIVSRLALPKAKTQVPRASERVAAWYAEDLVAAGIANNATVGTSGVSEWVDRMNGIHAVIGGGTPKLLTNRENGLPSVQFPGNSWLTAGQNATLMATLNSQTYTVMAVVRAVLVASNGTIACTTGTTNFFFKCDGSNIGQGSVTEVPFSTTQGAGLFSAGIRGSKTGAAWGTSAGYSRCVVNGCASRGSTTIPRLPTGGSDFLIGGQGGAAAKLELLELHVWPFDFIHAEDMQFEKYRCDKYAKTYPWLLSPLNYIPVLSGDSISEGVLADSWATGTVGLLAAGLGLTYGQYIAAATAAITIPDILLKDAVTLKGLPQQTNMPMKIHEFEWVNSIGGGASTGATNHGLICNMYRRYGFNKIILGTTCDYGNRTAAKASFITAILALPAGTADYINRIDLDTNIGIDGAAPNSGSNTYFADTISHPTGHANFPTVQSGYPILANLIIAAFQAV